MAHSLQASPKPKRGNSSRRWDADGYTLLRETSRLISSVPDISVLLELLYDEIRKLIAADTYFVTLYDPQTDEVSIEILIDEGERFPRTRQRVTTGLTRWVIDRRRPLLVHDMEQDELPCKPIFMGKPRMSRSWLGVPMLLGDRVVGVLVAASYTPNAYDEEHREILLHVASQAAVAIENARLYQEIHRRVRELDALQRVSVELVSSLDLSAVLRLVVQTALELTGANDAHVFLYDEATERLSFGAALWITGETDLRPETTPRPDGITLTCVRSGEAVVINDCLSHPLFQDPASRTGGLRSIVSLPLRRASHVLGALNVAFVEPHVFGEDEMRLLGLLADQAAIAIDNARLFQAARGRAERLAAVGEIAKAITATFDLNAIMAAVSQSLMPLLPHEHMGLWRPGASGGWAAIGAGGEGLAELHVALDSLYRSGLPMAPVVWEAGTGQKRRHVGQALESMKLGALVLVPVVADGVCTGIWTVGARAVTAFGSEQLKLLSQVSGHLAIAIRNAQLYAEMKHALECLQQSQTQLVRSERMRALAELSAGVAHDFNNVLTSILGRVHLMLTHVQDPATRESLRVIERAARNGAQTVRRIMGFARHREGEEFMPLDVNCLVEDAILLTEPRWRNPMSDRPPIDLKFQRGRPMTVMGSVAELSDVLTNLIFNAVDAMPAGGQLVLETRRDGNEAVIRVRDTGVGMPRDVMNQLFTPFFTTKGGHNVGMGLSMAREIVARHGGRIQVHSELGKGSTFSVRLPLARNVQPHQFKEELPMTQPTQVPRSLSILVVEDEESIRRLLSSILGLEGHEVRTFRTASEGIASFQERGADLVITDLGLPDQSGWEVARQVKAASPATPVILITGWGVSAEVTEARRRGVDYVLPKPFEFEELSALISRALSNLSERREV